MEKLKKTVINVELEGISNIMFDRFFDHSKEDKPPEQKLYLEGQNNVVLPLENMRNFLCRKVKPVGIIKVVEERKAENYLRIIPAYCFFSPIGEQNDFIHFLDGKKKPIKFNGFKKKKFILFHSSTVTVSSGGIPVKQPIKPRPQMKLPWFLQFQITLFENNLVDEGKLRNYYDRGGLEVGLCNGRPWFGRFIVSEWEVIGQ